MFNPHRACQVTAASKSLTVIPSFRSEGLTCPRAEPLRSWGWWRGRWCPGSPSSSGTGSCSGSSLRGGWSCWGMSRIVSFCRGSLVSPPFPHRGTSSQSSCVLLHFHPVCQQQDRFYKSWWQTVRYSLGTDQCGFLRANTCTGCS